MDRKVMEQLHKLKTELSNKRYGDPNVRRRNQWRAFCIRKGISGLSSERNQSRVGYFVWDPE